MVDRTRQDSTFEGFLCGKRTKKILCLSLCPFDGKKSENCIGPSINSTSQASSESSYGILLFKASGTGAIKSRHAIDNSTIKNI